jgi:hypothetical protein
MFIITLRSEGGNGGELMNAHLVLFSGEEAVCSPSLRPAGVAGKCWGGICFTGCFDFARFVLVWLVPDTNIRMSVRITLYR